MDRDGFNVYQNCFSWARDWNLVKKLGRAEPDHERFPSLPWALLWEMEIFKVRNIITVTENYFFNYNCSLFQRNFTRLFPSPLLDFQATHKKAPRLFWKQSHTAHSSSWLLQCLLGRRPSLSLFFWLSPHSNRFLGMQCGFFLLSSVFLVAETVSLSCSFVLTLAWNLVVSRLSGSCSILSLYADWAAVPAGV